MARHTAQQLIGNEGYGVTLAAKASGISLSTLQRWLRSGFIKPSMPRVGKRQEYRFSFADLVTLRTIGKLKTSGVSVQKLKKVLSTLKKIDASADLTSVFLVSNGKEIYRREGDQLIGLLQKPGQMAFSWWFIDLGTTQQEVREALRGAA
jgi:DNA-binding transcriptional MerR regulator